MAGQVYRHHFPPILEKWEMRPSIFRSLIRLRNLCLRFLASRPRKYRDPFRTAQIAGKDVRSFQPGRLPEVVMGTTRPV